MRTTRLVSPFGNMDIFFQGDAIGNRIIGIFESIIQDEHECGGKSQGTPRKMGWCSNYEIKGLCTHTEYQRMPGITFQQFDDETSSLGDLPL